MMESKSLRSGFGSFFRADAHQSAKLNELLHGSRLCHARGRSTPNQISLAKGQLMSRCVMVSEFWQQRAQLSLSCRLCRFLLAAVQHRSWSTSHPKNLHLPGDLCFARIFAPGIECFPMKKDLYAEAVEKF